MEKWPTAPLLARASLPEVLSEWSGLGYNRRARFLMETARVITETYGGEPPRSTDLLDALPGVGPYTAGAIACFAFNEATVFLETNIRAVMLHFFFPDRAAGKDAVRDAVQDCEILPLLEENLDRENPRRWYYALMDYGAALKRLTPNPGRRSATYRKQSAFRGSLREVRGSVVRALLKGVADRADLRKRLDLSSVEDADVDLALKALEKDGMVAEKDGVYYVPEGPVPSI
jgi:A/G-specific adenine glycosylase